MTLPTYGDLAGPPDRIVTEAIRLAKTIPAFRTAAPDDGAKKALIGATDASAREGALRWLESRVSSAIDVAQLIHGDRADADDTRAWDAAALPELLAELEGLLATLQASTMPRDPDWPMDLETACLALFDPTTRGEATRLLRDMWHRAFLWGQREAPGQFPASVGITAQHVQTVVEAVAETQPPETLGEIAAAAFDAGYEVDPILVAAGAESDENDEGETLETISNPPEAIAPLDVQGVAVPPGASLTVIAPPKRGPGRPKREEHPPMPDRIGTNTLPGAEHPPPVQPAELAEAFRLLAESVVPSDGMPARLGISKSTWNNWLSGRAKPRLTLEQARVLRAECARVLADVAMAESIFRRFAG